MKKYSEYSRNSCIITFLLTNYSIRHFSTNTPIFPVFILFPVLQLHLCNGELNSRHTMRRENYIMRKEVNYIEECRGLWESIKSDATMPVPESNEWREEMKLCLDYSDLDTSQYKRVKNTDKWHKVVDIIFP